MGTNRSRFLCTEKGKKEYKSKVLVPYMSCRAIDRERQPSFKKQEQYYSLVSAKPLFLPVRVKTNTGFCEADVYTKHLLKKLGLINCVDVLS